MDRPIQWGAGFNRAAILQLGLTKEKVGRAKEWVQRYGRGGKTCGPG
jgi:hypothetical protein